MLPNILKLKLIRDLTYKLRNITYSVAMLLVYRIVRKPVVHLQQFNIDLICIIIIWHVRFYVVSFC